MSSIGQGDLIVARIGKKQPSKPLLPEKKQRICVAKSHVCLRAECLLSAILVGLLAMIVTWGSSSIVDAGYELVQARGCLSKVEKQNEVLRLEMARLKSPQRVQEIAVGQLGMINPQNVYVAVKVPSVKIPVAAGNTETVMAQHSILFGNSKAEAHTIQQ